MSNHRDQQARFREELGIGASRNEPAAQLVDGAKWAVPDVISDIEKDPYLPRGSNGSVAVAVSKLVFRLAGEGHSRDAAAWSIYGLIASGRLGAELATIRFPEPADPASSSTDVMLGDDIVTVTDTPSLHTISSSSEPGAPIEARLPDSVERKGTSGEVQYLVVWATDELWFWWRDQRGAFIEEESKDHGYIRWPEGRFAVKGKNWHLLCTLWGHRKVSFADVGEEVWDDGVTKLTTIRSQISRLNDHLAGHGFDLSWDGDGEYAVLVTQS